MTKPACWPNWLDEVWAKSAAQGRESKGEKRGESLAQHTWYVLERLGDFMRLRPSLPQTLGVPRLWQILFWAAFLHDFGKAATGFQSVLRGGPRWTHRHEVLSLAFVEWIAAAFTPDEQVWLVAAIVSHHKDTEIIAKRYPQPRPGDDWEDDQLFQRMQELSPKVVEGLWRWLAHCGEEWIATLGMGDFGVTMPPVLETTNAVNHVTQQGARSIYRWLRLYRRFIDELNASADPAFIVGTIALRGYLVNSDQSASAHAGSLPRATCEAEAILASRGLQRNELFTHQLDAGATHGSVLLTAPTGSGKTEAALLWAARQTENGTLTRLFYTLPYQASMNAMQLRLEESFGKKLVGLQHGRSLLALYRRLLDKEDDPQAAARAARWARNLAQLNYPPIRVFSPYQMLKGLYRLRSYEAILADFYGATFIFDEIHAYEPARLAMILQSIEYLARHFQARFLVMSATFPTLIKKQLRAALGNPVEINAKQAVFDQFLRHRLHLLDGEVTDADSLARIETDARRGKAVLVVCNVVDRAQRVYAELCARLAADSIQVELLHGRFNGRDRLAKESIVREATGSKSSQRRPIVLVATQAVEVSLDIDLDTLYSDPAPLEALVQRCGRVNRRRLQSNLAPVYIFRQPDEGQRIYDGTLVRATLQILGRENGKPLDESAVGGWLDEIYSGEIEKQWLAEFTQAADNFSASCVQELRAFQADPNLEELFYKAFDSVEVLPNDLYDEFMELKEREPIRAGELLVPIRWGRYQSLARLGLLKMGDKEIPPVTLTPYNSQVGLTFTDPRILPD